MKIGEVVVLADRGEQVRRPRSYREIRDAARLAEAEGLDSIWLYDHLLYRPEGEPTLGIWECWTMLSALAEATERVEIGTLVSCTQFRNPAILAKMAVTADEVSGGRFVLGLGAGWNRPEFDAFGIPFDHRIDRFEEALQIVAPLVREGEVDFEGRYYCARDCEIVPRGPRPGEIPLLIGGWGPRILRLAARYGDFWNAGYYGRPETFEGQLTAFERARSEIGRDPSAVRPTVVLYVVYPDLEPTPPDLVGEHMAGQIEGLAQAFREYEARGVVHVMCHLVPDGPEPTRRLAEAVRLYRAA